MTKSYAPCKSASARASLLAAAFLATLMVLAGGVLSHTSANPAGNNGGGFGVQIDIGRALQQVQQSQQRARQKKQKARKKVPAKRRKATRRNQRPAPVRGVNAVGDEIIIVFTADAADAAIDEVLQDFGLTRRADAALTLLGVRIVRAGFTRAFSPINALRLVGDLRVVSVQPNYLFDLAAQKSAQYAVAKLGLDQAHPMAQGEGVVVGIIDSGVDPNHPALAGAILGEFDALSAKGARSTSHGNAVASIIAARDGMVGVAPNAKIVSVRAFARDRRTKRVLGTSFDLARGFDWAVSQGVRVLNLSFAGPDDPLLRAATSAAYKLGVVMVAAAGNRGPKAPESYPAAYTSVIGVTATGPKDKLYARANRGSYVMIAAPGVNVLAASRKKRFRLTSGTSMAAAYVTGSVALMMQLAPSLTVTSVMRKIAASAKDLGPEGWDPAFGYGLLNVYQAVNGSSPPTGQ